MARKKVSKKERLCKWVLEKHFDMPFTSIRPDWLKNPMTGRNLELDCYNEELGLALEYNGKQHYKFKRKYHKNKQGLTDQQERDRLKEQLCKDQGVKLIIVPYTTENIYDYITREIQRLQVYKQPRITKQLSEESLEMIEATVARKKIIKLNIIQPS